MKGKTVVALALGAAMVMMLGFMVLSTDWQDDSGDALDEMHRIPFMPSEDVDFKDTLNYAMFETYGPVIMVVTLLLFGAIIGGAAISREDDDE